MMQQPEAPDRPGECSWKPSVEFALYVSASWLIHTWSGILAKHADPCHGTEVQSTNVARDSEPRERHTVRAGHIPAPVRRDGLP